MDGQVVICGHCGERAKKTQRMRMCKLVPYCQHVTGAHAVCDTCWNLVFADAPPEPKASLPDREIDILRRFLLAEFFTSPSQHLKPRITAGELHSLIKRGFLQTHPLGSWRCTEAGKAELNIAGIDTRTLKAAGEWKPKAVSK